MLLYANNKILILLYIYNLKFHIIFTISYFKYEYLYYIGYCKEGKSNPLRIFEFVK